MAYDIIRFRSCVDDRETGTLCDRVYDWTGTKWLAESANWLLAKPAAVVTILVIAVLIRWLLHRVIRRLAHRAAEGTVPGVLAKGRGHRLLEGSPLLSERRKQRADTMASVLRSITTGVVMSVAFLMILDVVGLPIGPLLASAGIVGVAVGFGAQSLVKDFLSGIFLILEDQYGVGDLVDTGMGTVGTIEASPGCGTRAASSGTSATARSCRWATTARAGRPASSTCRSPTRRTSRGCSS